MDLFIHNIKTFECLVFTPHGHTEHKTQRALRQRRGKASGQDGKPPPAQCKTHCGLLDDGLMAVDFTNYRRVGRHLAFINYFIAFCSLHRNMGGASLLLLQWQCFIAKYP